MSRPEARKQPPSAPAAQTEPNRTDAEAHFRTRAQRDQGQNARGAKRLRDALPNASFIGFTGTPIEAEDVNTPALFGGYIDIYDISRAVEDGATVPIYYESHRFSERLEDAIARYHTNAISTVEVLRELIEIAKEVRAAQARGEEEGLSDDELAFYDALAENESAVEVMGSDDLKVIAHELLVQLQGNITVDWAHRESRIHLSRSVGKMITISGA